ncbi:MAG: LSM domain-containing protein [Nitrososphaerota archaeon]|nr:ribonucleoprotein [Candidatus Bathyarchaeota archaeon]MDW8048389.1 LSM domain-containing protein [Nitrososphaerota archaeon]
MEPSKKPLNMLTRELNGYIAIVLKNGVEYRGKMVHCDSYMNIILDGASEYNNGNLLAHYGQVLVRGNNILYIILNATPTKENAYKPPE